MRCAGRWILPLLLVHPVSNAQADADQRLTSATAMGLRQSGANADPFCRGEWGYNEQQCPEDLTQESPYGVYVQTRDAWCRGMQAFAKQEFKRAYDLLLPFVGRGDPAAKIRVGYLLSLKPLSWPGGTGVFAAGKTRDIPLDLTRGLELLQESAARGCASGKTLLAIHYFSGTSIPRNKAKAFRLATEAAREGHGAAMHFLSLAYLVEKDYARYYKWKYLEIHCGRKKDESAEVWKVMRLMYFDAIPEYRNAIPTGEELLKKWKTSNRGRMCPRFG